jgi:hypothetical protein
MSGFETIRYDVKASERLGGTLGRLNSTCDGTALASECRTEKATISERLPLYHYGPSAAGTAELRRTGYPVMRKGKG